LKKNPTPQHHNDLAITDVLTSAETAELTHIKEGTLRYWRATGQGPAWFRLGPRRIAYRRSDVEQWIRSQFANSYVDPARTA
jgi:prophage regulatory protein